MHEFESEELVFLSKNQNKKYFISTVVELKKYNFQIQFHVIFSLNLPSLILWKKTHLPQKPKPKRHRITSRNPEYFLV